MKRIAPTNEEVNEINKLIQSAEVVGTKAVDFSAERLRVCLHIGECLARWKKDLGHGQWEAFANERIKIGERARRSWMKLAHAQATGRFDVSTANGLRHAYMLAGILPDSQRKEAEAAAKVAPTNYLVHLTRLLAALAAMDVPSLTDAERMQVKARLKPVANIYASI